MKRPSTIAKEAFVALYPHIDISKYEFVGKYSGQFKDYNANISMRSQWGSHTVTIKLAKQWHELSEELQKGLMQHLMLKLFKKRMKPAMTKTMCTEMYEHFIDNIGKYAAIQDADPILLDSFNRINAEFFDGLLEQPNLIWGGENKRKMGHYDYQRDTIMISGTLRDRIDLVDFVMYHEMLHKKHKFYKSATGRHMHHHSAFREEEQQYPDFAKLEKELARHASAKRRSKRKWWEWV